VDADTADAVKGWRRSRAASEAPPVHADSRPEISSRVPRAGQDLAEPLTTRLDGMRDLRPDVLGSVEHVA
jgi:hypothetical protein